MFVFVYVTWFFIVVCYQKQTSLYLTARFFQYFIIVFFLNFLTKKRPSIGFEETVQQEKKIGYIKFKTTEPITFQMRGRRWAAA